MNRMSRKDFVSGVVSVAGLAMCSIVAVSAAQDFSVAENTGAAIQAAIDAAGAAGGGRVVVPPGTYPSGTLTLRSHVELHLEKGAVVLGSTNRADFTRIPLELGAGMTHSLVRAWDVEDIAITGEGVFDAQGTSWFEKRPWHGTDKAFFHPKSGRPMMVAFFRCKGVRFRDVSFLNSASWTMHVKFCENLDFARIKVLNDLRFINADGIDFDGCRHIRLANSDFLTGDDSVVARAIRPKGSKEKVVLEDMVVEDCRFESGCQCVRMGCPSDDTIRDVHFRHITMKGRRGVRFNYPVSYLSPSDEGLMSIHDVSFENVTGEVRDRMVQIDCAPGVKIRGVADILFRNWDVKSGVPLEFVGNAWSKIERIRRENFKLNGERLPDGEFAVDCTNAQPLRRFPPGHRHYRPAEPYVPQKYPTVASGGTAAIQTAIDEVAANATGGRVTAEAGEYTGASVRLRTNVELRLEKGAVLKAPVIAEGVADAALVGPGTISAVAGKTGPLARFVRCRRLRLDGVTFLDAVGRVPVAESCDDIQVDGLSVYADAERKFPAAFAFTSCTGVRVANCSFPTPAKQPKPFKNDSQHNQGETK